MDSPPWHASWGGCFLRWRRFSQRGEGGQQWGRQICKHQLSERLPWIARQGLDCQVRGFRCILALSYLTDCSSRLKRTLEIEPFHQIGRRVNVENALCRARCSFPILSHSRPGSFLFRLFSRWPNQDCQRQLVMLLVSFFKTCSYYSIQHNTTHFLISRYTSNNVWNVHAWV